MKIRQIYMNIVVAGVVLASWYLVNKRCSSFWLSQPISRYGGVIPEGLIQDISTINTSDPLPDKFYWHRPSPLLMEKFLTKYHVNYSEQYLLTVPFIHGLFDDKKRLIGTIAGWPMRFKIKDKTMVVMLVDMLCVREDQRRKGYAPLLINKIVDTMKENSIQVAIFNKDRKPLSVRYFAKSEYYATDKLQSHVLCKQRDAQFSLKVMTNEQLPLAHDFYNKHIIGDVVRIFTSEEFANTFKHVFNMTGAFVFYKNDQIIGISHYVMERTDKTAVRVVCHLSDSRYKIQHDIAFVSAMEERGIKKIYLTDTPFHKSLIRTCNLHKVDDTFYHFYNYHLDSCSCPIF